MMDRDGNDVALFGGRFQPADDRVCSPNTMTRRGLWDGVQAELHIVQTNELSPGWRLDLSRRSTAPAPPAPAVLGFDVDADAVAIVTARPTGTPVSELPAPAVFADACQLLEAIAGAIDRLHGFRLKHGSLEDRDVLVEGSAVWIRTSLPAAAASLNGNRLSAGQRDLQYFSGLCQRLLHRVSDLPPTTAATLAKWNSIDVAGPTALALLHQLNPPVAETATDSDGQPAPAGPATPLPRLLTDQSMELLSNAAEQMRETVDWPRSTVVRVIVVLCIATVSLGFLAHRYRANPMAQEIVDLVWDRLFGSRPESANGRSDGSPLSLLGPDALVHRVYKDRSAEHLRELFCENTEGYLEALDRLISINDGDLHNFIRSQFNDGDGKWQEQALPRVRALRALGSRDAAAGATRTLDRILLRYGGAEDATTFEQLLDSPNPYSRLDAFEALTRLGRRPPFPVFITLYERASDEQWKRLLETALNTYSYDEAGTFLQKILWDDARRPKPLLLAIASEAPSENTDRLLEDTLPTLIASDSDEDVSLLFDSLVRLQQARRLSPPQLVAALRIDDVLRKQIAARLVRILVQEHHTTYLVDGWYSWVIDQTKPLPADYLRILTRSRSRQGLGVASTIEQSRILSLLNATDDETERARISTTAIAGLSNTDLWMRYQPALGAAELTVLASTGTPESSRFLNEFLGASYSYRHPLFWEAAIVGAMLNPVNHRPWLERAAAHPIPVISVLAQRAFALSGDQFRSLAAIRPAGMPAGLGYAEILNRLKYATNAADVAVVYTQVRDPSAIDLLLPIAGSSGCRELLEQRLGMDDQSLTAYYSFALCGGMLEGREPKWLANSTYDGLIEQFVLLSLGLQPWPDWRPAIEPIASRSWEPGNQLYSRYLAVRALTPMKPSLELLRGIIETDSSALVQHEAALAYLATAETPSSIDFSQLFENASLDSRVRKTLERAGVEPSSR